MSQPPHRVRALNPIDRRRTSTAIRSKTGPLSRELIGRLRSATPSTAWARRAGQVHWLEYASGVLVLALIIMQAFRPGLPQRIDPRALLPSFDAIALGRAAMQRIAPSVYPVSEPAPQAIEPEPASAPAIVDEVTEAPVAAPAVAKPRARRSGYVEGYAQLEMGGSGSVTIDNAGNDADVFVNLVRLGASDSVATRVVIVAAGDRFAVTGVQRGRYELRYRDLRTGVLDRTSPFVLTERRTRNGVSDGRTVISLNNGR